MIENNNVMVEPTQQPKFPLKWNEKMGISEEGFVTLMNDLEKAYKMNVIVPTDIEGKSFYTKAAATMYDDVYANTSALINEKKHILKDVTPEQVLLAFTDLSMIEMEKSKRGANIMDSPNYTNLIEIGKYLLSGKEPTEEAALKIGNMMLNYQPDAVQKKIAEIRQQTFSRSIIAEGPFECEVSVFKRGTKKHIPQVDVEVQKVIEPIEIRSNKGGNDGL